MKKYLQYKMLTFTMYKKICYIQVAFACSSNIIPVYKSTYIPLTYGLFGFSKLIHLIEILAIKVAKKAI